MSTKSTASKLIAVFHGFLSASFYVNFHVDITWTFAFSRAPAPIVELGFVRFSRVI